jgi:hypothetical protein
MREFVPGGIVNQHGDLFGTSPLRIIRHGRVVIDSIRAGAAIMSGWKVVPKVGECDDDFAWLERSEDDRRTVGIARGLPE